MANAHQSEYPSLNEDVWNESRLEDASASLPLKRTTRQVPIRPYRPFIAGAAVGRLTSPYRYAAIASSPSYYYPTYNNPCYNGR